MKRLLIALVNLIGWAADRALTAFPNTTDDSEN